MYSSVGIFVQVKHESLKAWQCIDRGIVVHMHNLRAAYLIKNAGLTHCSRIVKSQEREKNAVVTAQLQPKNKVGVTT